MSVALHSKLPGVGTTIFTRMSALAQRHNAINLSQGFPDFEPPAPLLDALARHVRDGKNQYAPMTGVPALREAIAAKVRALYAATVDADSDVTVTSGATEALFCAIHATVRAGDEVIVFDPAYDAYEPAVALAGGRTVHLPLAAPSFAPDWQALGDALNERTRLVILNSPHNPTGAVLDAEDLDRLAGLLRPWNCFVLSDEVYEHIVFDGRQHASVLGHEELAARSFAVSSFGKTYHATGWKIGYCVAPAALGAEFRKVHQYNTFATPTPMQWALADMLTAHAEHHEQLPDFYQAKRDRFAALLAESSFTRLPCAGTYFQLVDYSGVGALAGLGDVECAEWLTREAGVAAIPVSVFYQSPPDARIVRFCFAKQDETLAAAAELLCRI